MLLVDLTSALSSEATVRILKTNDFKVAKQPN